MNSFVAEELAELEALRGTRALVYMAEDRAPFPKAIDDEDVPVIDECLRSLGVSDRLDLVLHVGGGRVSTSRTIAILLRHYAREVHVLVPYKARSAGTLLCLGADRIVMGPLAELSPIDPQIKAASDPGSGTPPVIAAEDIRAFKEMAERWFGLDRPEHHMQLFNLLCQRFFPTTLSAFYRAEQQVRRLAGELLLYQLPDASAAVREQIVDQLVSGYYTHDDSILCAEAQQVGLRAQAASPQEEALLRRLWQRCRSYLETPLQETYGASADERVDGVIASRSFMAAHVRRWIDYQPAGGAAGVPGARTVMDARWRIL